MELSELLKAAGLDDEQVATVTKSFEENKMYVTDQENASVRLAKLKTERDEATASLDELKASNEELKSANEDLESGKKTFEDKITELEAKGSGDEETQTKLEDLQKQLEEANNKNATMTKSKKLEAALRKAGATDTDYVAYKLGGVDKIELDDDGNIVDWDKTLSGIQETMPKYFVNEEQSSGVKLNGDGKKPIETDPFQKVANKYQEKLEER